VFRRKLRRFSQRLFPAFRRLARDCKDQIYIRIVYACPADYLPGIQKLPVVVDSSQHPQLLIFRRLQSDGNPVHSGRFPSPDFFFSYGFRIGLDGDLRAGIHREVLPQHGEYVLNLPGR
jgi:hypothetical protein